MSDSESATAIVLPMDDWQLSILFLREPARTPFAAIHKLRSEMDRIVATASDVNVSLAKLAWWRNEIRQLFTRPVQHPLLKQLAKSLSGHDVAVEYLEEIIDAAEMELVGISNDEIPLYCYRRDGVLAELLAHITGNRDRNRLRAARAIGETRAHLHLLVIHLSSQGCARLVSRLHGQDNSVSPDRTLLESHDSYRIQARTAMENVELPAALMMQWRFVEQDYRKIRNSRSPATNTRLTAHPLRKLWTAWRTARNTHEHTETNQ